MEKTINRFEVLNAFGIEKGQIPENFIDDLHSYVDEDNEENNKFQIIELEIEDKESEVKNLQLELNEIIKERDEILEEYYDELKAIKMQNKELERENHEMKQETVFLYSILESFHCHSDQLKALKKKNRDLEDNFIASTEYIKELGQTNNRLVRNLPIFNEDTEEITVMSSESQLKSLVFEKNRLMKKIVDLDNVYFNCIQEMDDLKTQLIHAKASCAESLTERNEFHKRLIDQKKDKKSKWSIFNFWKNTNN